MRKVKDKTNILVIMQSLSRQMFNIQVFGTGDRQGLKKRIALVKQVFNKNELLKIELRLRNLIESTNIKDPDKRRKFVNSIVKVAKKMNSSHAKKKLAQSFGVSDDYWVKPNSVQQNIGNMLNNAKYYGMRFYKPEQQQVRYVLKQRISRQKSPAVRNIDTVQKLCEDFNSKYRQLPDANKKLVRQFFMGNIIQQKKVLDEVNLLRQGLGRERNKKLQYIVQNVSSLDKFQKIFILTSILEQTKTQLNG